MILLPPRKHYRKFARGGAGASAEQGIEALIRWKLKQRLEQKCVVMRDHFDNDPQIAVAQRGLQQLLTLLRRHRPFRFEFDQDILGALSINERTLVHRLSCAIAGVRSANDNAAAEIFVLEEDYELASRILGSLPIARQDSSLSAGAIHTAKALFSMVQDPNYRKEIDGLEHLGTQLFATGDVARLTNQSYNGAKDDLKELEREGIVHSSLDAKIRKRGREILLRLPRWSGPTVYTAQPIPSPSNGCRSTARESPPSRARRLPKRRQRRNRL